MTNKELLQYKNVCFCIRKYKEELKQLEIKISGASAANLTGMPRSGKTISTVESSVLRKEALEERISKLQQTKESIEMFVKSINDPLVQLLSEQRYIKGLSWDAVALSIGGYNTASSVRMIVKRYIEKNQEQG